MTALRPTRPTLLAVALAALFTLAWIWRDWANLSILRLPDTDDAMRLQQIRDWLGGQGWSDLSQHRLGDTPARRFPTSGSRCIGHGCPIWCRAA